MQQFLAFSFLIVLVGCGSSTTLDQPSSKGLPEVPKVLIDSPHEFLLNSRQPSLNEGVYSLRRVKLSYREKSTSKEVRFEDQIYRTDSLYFHPEVLWEGAGEKMPIPDLHMDLPVRVRIEQGLMGIEQGSSYETQSYEGSRSGGSKYYDLERLFESQFNRQVSRANNSFAAIERAPGAFRFLAQYDSPLEEVVINLYFENTQ